jgi:hypothetical protein
MELLKEIITYFGKEGAVITQAPVIFATAVVLVGGVIWLLMQWRFGGQIAALREQLALSKDRLEKNEQKDVPLSLRQCIIQVVSHEFYWLGSEGEWHRFKAEPDAPQGAKRGITLWVTIIAPSLLVEAVKLVIMKEQLPLNWDSVKVFYIAEKHIHTLIPEYVSSGTHQVKLNQTTRLWHSAAQVEKTPSVRSERSRASGEVEERTVSGLSGLRLRCATLRPNGERLDCQ